MNKWKKAFFIIAGIDIIILFALIVIFIVMTSSPERQPPVADQKILSTSPVFTVNADKGQITKLVNDEISKHPTGNLTFHVEMKNTLDLIGDLRLFGLSIPFTMNFKPSVDTEGNIVLNEKGVTLGRFSLPESQVLKFVKAGADLPKWVFVNPDKEEIYIDMNSVLIKDRFYLKAKEIDLPNNKLVFNVFRKSNTKK